MLLTPSYELYSLVSRLHFSYTLFHAFSDFECPFQWAPLGLYLPESFR